MPTYEYHCLKCQKNFDAVQSMKDDRFKTCPENHCQMEGGWGQGEVTRLLGTGAGLIFKGSGFYITDYRSEGYKKSAQQEASGAGGGSSEKKPAAADGGGEKSKSAPASTPSAGGSGASPAPKSPASSPPASAPSPKKE